MYAITETSFRVVTADMPLVPGETRADALPAALLARIRSDKARAERSERLRSTDWTQMADAPLTVAEKLAMSVYRQALRDLPGVAGFPDLPWPGMPNLSAAASGSGSGQAVPIG